MTQTVDVLEAVQRLQDVRRAGGVAQGAGNLERRPDDRPDELGGVTGRIDALVRPAR